LDSFSFYALSRYSLYSLVTPHIFHVDISSFALIQEYNFKGSIYRILVIKTKAMDVEKISDKNVLYI